MLDEAPIVERLRSQRALDSPLQTDGLELQLIPDRGCWLGGPVEVGAIERCARFFGSYGPVSPTEASENLFGKSRG